MNEMTKARHIELTGIERDKALEKFRQQIKKWDLALPPVQPLVLDFGLGQFYTTGLIELWIANEIEAGYCGKYLFVFDGQTCPMHRHKEKHETFFIVEGSVAVNYDGKEMLLNKGDVLPVKENKKHSFTGQGPALLLELSKPCIVDDNYFENKHIPIGGNFNN